MQTYPHRRAAARPRRVGVLLVALLACAALLPPVVVDDGLVPGADLAVTPGVVRVAAGTTVLRVGLGVDAPAPVLVGARVTAVELSPDGVATPSDDAAGWAGTSDATTPLRPGEALDVAVVVDQPPADGLAAVVVRGVPATEPRTNELVPDPDGDAVEVVALLLADGPAGPPDVTLERDGDRVELLVTAPRPVLVGVAGSARGVTREARDRMVVPGRATVVELALPGAPWPLEAEVVDDAGGTATARVGPGLVLLVVPAVVLLLLATGLLVVARRRGRT